jgi:tRNA G37 N-methylase TrmD
MVVEEEGMEAAGAVGEAVVMEEAVEVEVVDVRVWAGRKIREIGYGWNGGLGVVLMWEEVEVVG